MSIFTVFGLYISFQLYFRVRFSDDLEMGHVSNQDRVVAELKEVMAKRGYHSDRVEIEMQDVKEQGVKNKRQDKVVEQVKASKKKKRAPDVPVNILTNEMLSDGLQKALGFLDAALGKEGNEVEELKTSDKVDKKMGDEVDKIEVLAVVHQEERGN